MGDELTVLGLLVLHIRHAYGEAMSDRDVESMVRIEVESHGSVEDALRHYVRMKIRDDAAMARDVSKRYKGGKT